jgi:protein transport protein DSL1/ZW10
MQQDEIESCVDSAVAHIHATAIIWEPILARSAWYQAAGSLCESLAIKIISDVMEMPSIGQDEAYSIAQLISKVTELDDLFLPSRASGKAEHIESGQKELPATAQYAQSWLRLQYLSEILQSDLKDVR